MKTLVAAFLFSWCTALTAQTTTVSATALRDQGGNLVNGSACFSTAALYQPTVPCSAITNGVMSVSIANGTYFVWLNEGSLTIFTTTGAVLSGGTIAADTQFFIPAYSVNVNGTATYFPDVVSTTTGGQSVIVPINAAFNCNGAPATMMTVPTSGKLFVISNTSTTSTCTITATSFTGGTTATTLVISTSSRATIMYSGASWYVAHLGT